MLKNMRKIYLKQAYRMKFNWDGDKVKKAAWQKTDRELYGVEENSKNTLHAI